jgi:purine-binding chemotaxis protein CheW
VEDLEPKRALLTFWMGSDPYGIFLEDAKEVLRSPAIFRAPSAPEYCRGIINLRGDIIGVVDPRRLFNLSGSTSSEKGHLIIIEKDEHMVGFLLDSTVGVAEIASSGIQPPLINIDKIKANFLEGECLMKDRIIAILNISNILNYL